jgi:hypothetical protein
MNIKERVAIEGAGKTFTQRSPRSAKIAKKKAIPFCELLIALSDTFLTAAVKNCLQ